MSEKSYFTSVKNRLKENIKKQKTNIVRVLFILLFFGVNWGYLLFNPSLSLGIIPAYFSPILPSLVIWWVERKLDLLVLGLSVAFSISTISFEFIVFHFGWAFLLGFLILVIFIYDYDKWRGEKNR